MKPSVPPSRAQTGKSVAQARRAGDVGIAVAAEIEAFGPGLFEHVHERVDLRPVLRRTRS